MAKGKASVATKQDVALVKEQATALAVTDFSEYADYADAGFENTTKDDFSVPFIRLLQPTSPSVVDQVEGHKGGHWINTATGEVYPEVNFVVSAVERLFVEWVPRKPDGTLPPDAGSGFVAVHKPDAKIVTDAIAGSVEFGQYSAPNGNDLVDTRYVYGLCISPTGEMFEAVIAFTSTHVKAFQNLMSLVRNQAMTLPNGERRRQPIFAHKVKLASARKEKGGNKWFVPVPDWASEDEAHSRLPVKSPEFQAAAAIYEAFRAGTTKVDLSQTASDRGAGRAGAAVDDKDIPF